MDWLKGKKHFFFFVSLLIAFIDASVLYFNYRISSTAFYTAIQDESRELNSAFHALIDQTGEHLELMAAYIANDDDVIRLLNEARLALAHEKKADDYESQLIRQELYASTISEWRYIQQHSDIYQLNFYSGTEGLHFLRVHRPESYGDMMDSDRPLFTQAIRSLETVSGIETGRYASNLSGFAPVFHFDMDSGEKTVAGVVEVGSSFRKDLIGFQSRLNAGAGVILPDNHHTKGAWSGHQHHEAGHLACDCVIDEASDAGLLQALLMRPVVKGLSLQKMDNMIIPAKGRNYAFMVHDLYPGQEAESVQENRSGRGHLVFWLDYTERYQAYKQSLQLNALLAVIAFLIVEALILIALRFYTRRLEIDVQLKTRELSRSEQQLKTAQKLAHIGHWEWDIQADKTTVSDEVPLILAFEPEECLTYALFLSRVHPEDRAEVESALKQSMAGQSCNLVHRLVHPDGRIRHVREKVVVATDKRGKAISMLGTMQDITPQVELQMALEAKEHLYRQMFERNKAVKLLIDPQSGAIVDANPAAVRYYGYTHEQLRSMAIDEINIMPHEEVEQAIRQANSEGKPCFHFQHRLHNGEIRDVEVYSGPVNLEGKEYLNSIVFDVTERNQLLRELEQVAFFDALTALPNRRSIDNEGENLIAQVLAKQIHFSVVMLDIDHFKRFNDTWGHDAGDTVLQEVAAVLKEVAGEAGIAGRFGGEEFIILLPDCDYSNALKTAQRVVSSVALTEISLAQETVRVTTSAGVATLLKDGICRHNESIDSRGAVTKFKQLVKQADECLYLAKAQGRNCVR